MIAPSNFDWESCVEIMLHLEQKWVDRHGPRSPHPVEPPPRTINPRVKAPKLRTFIRGNARMT